MKKKFIEPEMKRIALNLNENIASSDVYHQLVDGMFKITHGEPGCLDNVQNTGLDYYTFDRTDEGWLASKRNGCFQRSAAEAALMRGLPSTYGMN